MNLGFLAFSERGYQLAQRLAQTLGGEVTRCGAKAPLDQWTREAFAHREGLVFVGAAGIAVRAIAPYLRHKTTDPAVVVVDEGGRFVIPILSGHLGGANALARRFAQVTGGIPVITTATDGRGLFAVDTWAKVQNCHVLEPERIKLVSARLLSGRSVRVHCPWPIGGEVPEGVIFTKRAEDCHVAVTLSPQGGEALHLVPKILVLGVGCRKGTAMETIEAAFSRLLDQRSLSRQAFCKVCSIDLKGEEGGLLAFCRANGLPFETYSPEALAQVPGTFTPSNFVVQVTGVDNVCERSAVLGSRGGELIQKKEKGNGVTLAVAQMPFHPDWRWQE